MEISVVVCSRNRASQLSEFLETMTCIEIPDDLVWELVIVDNGSTDNTQQVIASFQERLPIRAAQQPIPGLSNARNAGVAAAKGTYIVWTDDDVKVETGWLKAYRQAFRRWPDAQIFGGKITPFLIPPTPKWFRRALPHLEALLAKRDFGSQPVQLSIRQEILPYGANWAVKTETQRKFLFDPALGVAPGRRMGGEEVDVSKKILNSGATGWWLPDAEVKHIITKARQTTDYIMDYYGAYGEFIARTKNDKSLARRLLGVPMLLWVQLPSSYIKFQVAYLLKQKNWVKRLASYGFRLGEFKAWRQLKRETP